MKSNPAVRALRARPMLSVAVLIAIGTLVNAALVGCGNKGQSSSTDTSTQNQTSTAPPAGGETATPPAATSGTASLDLGKQVYMQRCALCHGTDGKGDGPAAASLNPKPRNHTDGAYMNARTDEELLTVIRNGKGAMPAWGSVLSETEIESVLKYVRSLAVPPYPG